MFSLQVAVSCSLVRLRSLRSSAGFSSAPQSQTAALHESSGKQEHYGCHSVSHSGNTVLQRKYNGSKRVGTSVYPAGRCLCGVDVVWWSEMRA